MLKNFFKTLIFFAPDAGDGATGAPVSSNWNDLGHAAPSAAGGNIPAGSIHNRAAEEAAAQTATATAEQENQAVIKAAQATYRDCGQELSEIYHLRNSADAEVKAAQTEIAALEKAASYGTPGAKDQLAAWRDVLATRQQVASKLEARHQDATARQIKASEEESFFLKCVSPHGLGLAPSQVKTLRDAYGNGATFKELGKRVERMKYDNRTASGQPFSTTNSWIDGKVPGVSIDQPQGQTKPETSSDQYSFGIPNGVKW